jgi:Uncharacterized protein conserved in bacteria
MSPSVAAYLNRSPIPARAGVGLRVAHYQSILEILPELGWLEVHSENYFLKSSSA